MCNCCSVIFILHFNSVLFLVGFTCKNLFIFCIHIHTGEYFTQPLTRTTWRTYDGVELHFFLLSVQLQADNLHIGMCGCRHICVSLFLWVCLSEWCHGLGSGWSLLAQSVWSWRFLGVAVNRWLKDGGRLSSKPDSKTMTYGSNLVVQYVVCSNIWSQDIYTAGCDQPKTWAVTDDMLSQDLNSSKLRDQGPSPFKPDWIRVQECFYSSTLHVKYCNISWKLTGD